jgi:enoyl-CoA hydratase/carnithine racemase
LAIASAPRSRLIAEAKAFLLTLIDKPRSVIAASKRVLQTTVDMPLDEAVAFELATFARYMRDEPHGREGYTAFREKRPPNWNLGSATAVSRP